MDLTATLVVVVSLLVICSGELSRQKIEGIKEKLKKLPSHDFCGKPSNLTKTGYGFRIMGGRPAALGAYPWMAVIGYKIKGKDNDKDRWLCGGSLITDQHVLTAAHCLNPALITSPDGVIRYKVTKVRLGELDLNPVVNDNAQHIDFEISDIIYSDKHDDYKKINDIGIIKLKAKVRFTELIKPICLPTADISRNDFVGYLPVVAGWGKLGLQSTVTNTRLLEVNVEISDLDGCKAAMATIRPRFLVDDTVICAGSAEKDSCQGDSGGPLMLYRKRKNAPVHETGNMYLLGIVSYGPECGKAPKTEFPGVYTRVSKQMSWILDNLDI